MNRNDRKITGFAMVGHGLVHTYELTIPVLVTVWLVEFPVTTATLGTVVAVGYALFGIGALPGGLLVDRFGSRPLVIACLAGMGLSFLLLSVLPGVAGITVALAVWGIAASIYHPAGLALISNGVTRRGKAFAYHGMAGNVGIAVGPFVTALVLVVADWRMATLILAGPALLAAAVGVRVEFDETAAVDVVSDGGQAGGGTVTSLQEFHTASRRLATGGFLLVLAIVVFNGLYYRGALTFLPELFDGLTGSVSDGGIGLFTDGPLAAEFGLARYLYVGLLTVGIAGQYAGGWLSDRVEPEYGLALLLAVLVAVALLFVPASASLPTLLAASAAFGFALFAMQPLSQATVAAYAPAAHRGLSFGYTYLAVFGVGALGATVAGTALAYGSPSLVFVVLAVFAAVGLCCALVLARLGS